MHAPSAPCSAVAFAHAPPLRPSSARSCVCGREIRARGAARRASLSRRSALSAMTAAVSAQPGVKTVEAQPVRNAIGAESTVLIVGASRGLGLEFARQVASRGARVLATHRGAAAPRGLAGLAATHERVALLALDVSDEASVRAAAAEVARAGGAALTHIIHNAGVFGRPAPLGRVSAEDMVSVFRINAVGVMNVVQAFAPLLAPPRGSALPVVAVLSSKVGSVDDNGSGGGYAYRASKSACNIICKSLSIDMAGTASVVLLHPGYVRTDMTGGSGLIDVDESVSGMLAAVEATDADVGFRWVDYKAELIPW